MTGLLLAVLVGFEGSNAYWHGSNWSVFDNGSTCAALATYEDNSSLWISHEVASNRTTFIIIDSAFKSVTSDKKYQLKLFFVKGTKLDDGWGTVDVTGVELEQDKALRFKLKGSEALSDLAVSQTIALMTQDDVVVSSLSLSGSGIAVPKLRECSLRAQRRNPIDPLDGAEQD